MDISVRLRTLREEHGYSQNDLAEKLNISRQSISKWELGKSTPDITYFIKLSEIYNLTLDELIKEKSREVDELFEEYNDNSEFEKESKDEILEKYNNEKNSIKDNCLKRIWRFLKDDFIYRHTNPELVKIKTIGWLTIIGIVVILVFIRS